MGLGTSWNPHDIDIVRGWMAEGKTTTGMAKLRPEWSKSSIKKLVARLKAAGGDTGAVYSRKRSITAASSAQMDELRAELPTLPRVSDLLLHSVAGAAQQMGEKSLQNNQSSADLSCYPSPSPGVLSLYQSQAWCSAPLV